MTSAYSKVILHSSVKSKSKYKGGFKNGKNTSAYNHDYYLKNKEKWNKKKSSVGGWQDYTPQNLASQFFANGVYKIIRAVKGPKKESDSLRNGTTFINPNAKSIVDAKKKFNPDNIDFVLTDLMSTDVKKNNGEKYKYKYRVKLPNGKYRYFYSDVEYYAFMKNAGLKNREASIEEDCAAVNPHYGEKGYDMNCPFATFAYDLRRRGYDAQAVYDLDGAMPEDIEHFYKNGKLKIHECTIHEDPMTKQQYYNSQDESDKLFNNFKSEGPGARGHLVVYWTSGGGHDMAWEVDKDGTPYVVDAQTNTVYSAEEFKNDLAPYITWYGGGTMTMRTDNLELNPDIVTKGHDMGSDYSQIFVSDSDNRRGFEQLDEYEWDKAKT